ncbi:MAG TPA: septum formation initiator family protein [Gemmatimonadaceae bacterium]|nr:septum formation initiator family protein [Gemmatimonadaceae bacterium]
MAKSAARARWKRVVLGAAVIGVVVFAVQGGEYGTWDLVRQQSRRERLQSRIDSLTRIVDSLERRRRAIRTDPAAQERIAREEFGMVKGDKELLYRFAEP